LNRRHKLLLELLEGCGAGLHALLTRLTLREDVAEELMQELFIKLSKARGLEKVSNLPAYARRAAINMAFDWHRRRQNMTVALDSVGEAASGQRSPLAKMIEAERLEEVLAGVGKLNASIREVFVLRHIQQLDYDEIARQTGKTTHQARALCHKALKRLRNLLDIDSRSSDKEASYAPNR